MDFSKWFHDTYEVTEEMQTEDQWMSAHRLKPKREKIYK